MRIAPALLTASLLLASSAFTKDKPEKGFKALFNGKDLTGWEKAKENEGTFSVKDGAIVAQGPRCHLYYTGPINKHNWKNFELKVDVMTLPSSNGGIYFHTEYQEKNWPSKGFEVQVNNSHSDWRRSGGLYAVADNKEKVAEDGKWFTEHIIVKDNHVTIFVDGKKTSEWTQPADWKGGSSGPGRVISSGTVALQGHDPKSTIHYKNIRIKALK
ncbi:MAG: DUF1080 domain-containing protein [Acidobacteria bacterium]|nr:DUF1080 domain-containing protein [Acidobacteriota bacterium]